MVRHPIHIWLIALFAAVEGAVVFFVIAKGGQSALQELRPLFVAVALGLAFFAASIYLVLGRSWSKYLFLSIGLVRLYSMLVFTDYSSVVDTGVAADGVLTTTYRPPGTLDDILWLIAIVFVWRYFRRRNKSA